jgi:Mg/Co/Ni transporter MgtE
MKTSVKIKKEIKLSFDDLVKAVKKLPKKERKRLFSMVEQKEDEPTKEQILQDLREDLIALKNGTLETITVEEFLDELRSEGYLI